MAISINFFQFFFMPETYYNKKLKNYHCEYKEASRGSSVGKAFCVQNFLNVIRINDFLNSTKHLL